MIVTGMQNKGVNYNELLLTEIIEVRKDIVK